MATASQVRQRDPRQCGETQPGLVKIEPGGRVSACMGCGGVISDQYILRVAPDMEWHAACLKCSECQQFLDETCTCFVRDGKTYCKRDYVRLFGAKCDKCGGAFSKADMVMRAQTKIFHLDCFRCRACGKQLLPGDEFAFREDDLLCRLDYDAIKGASTLFIASVSISSRQDATDDNHNSDPVQLAEEPELAAGGAGTRSGTEASTPGPGQSGSGGGGTVSLSLARRDTSGKIHKSEGKPTRIRTVLTEKQLHTLRTCYAANCRPDALMKEQLVEMTGLSPRVIRVWFQNKRCKDKKRSILMKQVALQDKSGRFGAYGSMAGIPLVASPPVHSDPQQPPIDVTAYQPPWKTLTEFALAHDLERLDPSHPQYQHMIQQMHGYSVEPDHSLLPVPHYVDDGSVSAPPFTHSTFPFPGTPSGLSSTSSD